MSCVCCRADGVARLETSFADKYLKLDRIMVRLRPARCRTSDSDDRPELRWRVVDFFFVFVFLRESYLLSVFLTNILDCTVSMDCYAGAWNARGGGDKLGRLNGECAHLNSAVRPHNSPDSATALGCSSTLSSIEFSTGKLEYDRLSRRRSREGSPGVCNRLSRAP